MDVAAFCNEYSDLLVLENGAVIAGTPPVLPVNWVNRIDGHTWRGGGAQLATAGLLAAQGSYTGLNQTWLGPVWAG